MRADNDQVLGNSVESFKDESKPHQEDAELKISENGKNNNNVCELFYDTRSGDEWEKENDGDILKCGNSNEAGKKIQDPCHDFTANGNSLEKVDPVFFMDKNVTVCDLPEIVVCYKENTYHVVKDICVDEGAPVQEKFLFSDKDSVNCSSNSNQRGSEDLLKADKTYVNPFETLPSEDSNNKVDDSKICNDLEEDRDVEESLRECFADAEGSSSCNQEEVKDFPSLSLNPFQIESEEGSKDEVATSSENFLKGSLTLGDILSREDEERPKEQSPPELQEKERSLETTGIETKLEELSSVSATTSQEPNKSCKDSEKCETVNQEQSLLLVDSYEEDKLFSSGFGHGETSFSAAEPFSISGHITYSGAIAFSGSLSVRSDASTTSARSFAFPILQSEWNSSPVRMAKADKRRQKGWRHSLLCCGFS